ncbi:MAG: hypothetical protein ACXVJD_09705 [Mucilaginibacter sp.]
MEKEIQKKQWTTPTVELISSALIESGNFPARPEGSPYFTIGGTIFGSGS